MSFFVKLHINDEPTMSTIVVRRMSGVNDPDSWCGYEYRVFWHNPSGGTTTQAAGEVRHRYGDGALVLLRKVLNDADLTMVTAEL